MLPTQKNSLFVRLLVFSALFALNISIVIPSLLFYVSPSTAFAQPIPFQLPPAYDGTNINTSAVNQWQQVKDLSFPIINHAAAQEFPAIDANRVVWQDARRGPADIFMEDLATKNIVNLTNSDGWEANPDIGGDYVVWRDGYDGIGIHGVKLSTGEQFKVTSGHSDVNAPRVADGYVVWAAKNAGDKEWKIYGFDIATAQQTVLASQKNLNPTVNIDGKLVVWTDSAGTVYLYDRGSGQTRALNQIKSAENPDVSETDQMIVWQDRRNGTFDIYALDLATNQELAVDTAPAHQAFPRIAHGLIAYQSQILVSSWNVHLFVLAEGRSFPLTANPNRQAMAVTDGKSFAWEDGRNHQIDIYGFVWNGEIPSTETFPFAPPTALKVGALPNGRIELHWQSSVDQVAGYEIERATGIIGTQWEQLAKVSAHATEYGDLPPALGESYWYRLRAFRGNEYSDYSNESFNSTFSTVPSLDEQYLLVLINEARSDPAKFGYPSYPAAPPLVANPLLKYAARSHSQSILNSGYQFGHCDPSGRCPTERAQAVGYTGNCSENLFTVNPGYQEMEFANKTFLESEGHRNAMLEAGFNEAGMGHTFDRNKGSDWRHGQVTEVLCGRADAAIPALPAGAVIPYVGTTTDTFTYTVNFYSKEGFAPTKKHVIIDGVAHEMALSTGTAANGTYRLVHQLNSAGDHSYYFLFEYGNNQQARWPQNGEMHDPQLLPEGAPQEIAVTSSSCQATLTWRTLGKATSQIDYGETLNYGQTITVSEAATEMHRAVIDGLLPNHSYHFRIRSTAANGSQPPPSSDQPFSTRSPQRVEVSPETENLQQRINGAQACDVVSFAPGTYSLNETLHVNNGAFLVGAGWDQSFLQGTSGVNVVALYGKALLSGFTVSGATHDNWSSGVWISDNASPTITENRIRGNQIGIGSNCFNSPCVSNAQIRNNLILNNLDGGIVDTVGGSLIVNNTIVANKDGIRVDSKSATSTVKNNIIVNNSNIGVLQANQAIIGSYNNLWGNQKNYEDLTAGTGDISADPLFVNATQQDYHLLPTSLSMDAGDPDARYLDDNGTRNDMGMFGGTTGDGRVEITATCDTVIPQPDGEVNFVIQVSNPAFNAKTVGVRVLLPAQATFVEGRINHSADKVTVDGSTLLFHDIELPYQGSAELAFRVRLATDLGTDPLDLNFPIEVKWGDYSAHSEVNLLVNGFGIYLPLVAR